VFFAKNFSGGVLMHRNRVSFIASLVLVLAGLATARAAIVPVPTGLQPGDKYYLAFLTNGTILGTSSDIADYNSFAQNQAALVPSLTTISGSPVTWKAAVSTPTVNALTNLGLGNFPIYRIDGVQIATGGTDLWDGSLANPINVDQYENSYGGGVVAWTGSNSNGTGYALFGGIQMGGASGNSITGAVASTTSSWMTVGSPGSGSLNKVYAFSSELVVPVPEPASVSVALCSVALVGWSLRRRARKA
jgi:hypothetical protein